MPDAPLTLSVLGGLEMGAKGLPISAAEREKLVQTLRDKAREFPQLSRHDLGDRLLDFVRESLSKPVASVLEEVWSQRKEMREAAEQGKEKPNVESDVELWEHTMTCELHPSVQLQLDRVTVGTMTFDVEVALKLEGVKLVMQNARITSVKAGTLTTTLSLEYQKLPLMVPKKQKFDLPLTLDLPGKGIDLSGSLGATPA